MRVPFEIGRVLPLAALLLPLCGCEVIGSVTGDAAKQFLDRASEEFAAGDAEKASGQESGNTSTSDAGSDANVYYQYVDDSGSVRFVQDRSQIPAKFRKTAGRLELETRPAGRSTAANTPTPRRDVWKQAAEAPWSGGGSDEIVMYTAPWCGVCKRADAYFRREGIRYTAKDIEASDAYKRELVQKTGRSAVPVIEIGEKRMVGWQPQRVAQLLDR